MLTHLWIGNGFTQREALDTYKDKKPELITVDDQVSKVFRDGDGGPDHRLARRWSRRRPRRPSARPATRAGDRQQGHRRHRRRPGQRRPRRAPGHRQGRARLDARDRREGRRAHRLRLQGHARAGRRGCGSRRSSRATAPRSRRARRSSSTTSARSTTARRRSTPATRGEPASFQIGAGKVIKGWDQALVGRAVGSRVLLVDPARPRLRQGRQQGRRHQGHRHAVLRRRHPGRGLTGPAGWAQMADHARASAGDRPAGRASACSTC